MLSVDRLTKIYTPRKGRAVRALDGVSLEFPEKGLVFLLGRSGSGKTTLLNILGGIDTPSYGEMSVDGRSFRDFSSFDLDAYRNSYVGFVFQEYDLIPEYTVGANIALALELQGKKPSDAVVDDALRRVDMVTAGGRTLRGRMVSELSGGQKQRVAIARALVKDPRVILADEPTGALDSKTGEQLYELLKQLSAEKLVIVVTHDRDAAEKYGDRVIELADGKVVRDSAPCSGLPPSPAGYASVKGHLRPARVLTMGLSGLKTKPFRLFMSVLLSVITIAMTGLLLTVSTTDRVQVELRTLADEGYEMVCAQPLDTLAAVTEEVRAYTGADPMAVYDAAEIGKTTNFAEHIYDDSQGLFFNAFSSMLYGGIYMLAEVDPVTGEEDARLTPDPRFEDPELCRLPEDYTEIAITDLYAEAFMVMGYTDESGALQTIDTPDDLIGKRLGDFTICGVYSTEISRDDLLELASSRSERSVSIFAGAQSGVPSFGYVCRGTYESVNGEAEYFFESHTLLLRLKNDVARDKEFLYSVVGTPTAMRRMLSSPVSGLVSSAASLLDFIYVPVTVATVVLVVFAVLLMTNFMTVSIDFKKRELGILRALGAGKSDVLAVCLAESAAIALSVFGLSAAAVALTCLGINVANAVSMFVLSPVAALVMFVLCVAVCGIATVIPVRRLISVQPVDIIRGK